MVSSNVFVIAYIVIGLIFCIYYWNKYYENTYETLKEIDEVEDAMASNMMIFIFLFWPIFLGIDIYKNN